MRKGAQGGPWEPSETHGGALGGPRGSWGGPWEALGHGEGQGGGLGESLGPKVSSGSSESCPGGTQRVRKGPIKVFLARCMEGPIRNTRMAACTPSRNA